MAERAFEEEVLLGRARSMISDLLDKQGLQQQELAEKLGVSAGRVSQMLSGAENMTLKTLAGIGHALGYRFELVAEAIAPGEHLLPTDELPPVQYGALPASLLKRRADHAEPREFAARVKQQS